MKQINSTPTFRPVRLRRCPLFVFSSKVALRHFCTNLITFSSILKYYSNCYANLKNKNEQIVVESWFYDVVSLQFFFFFPTLISASMSLVFFCCLPYRIGQQNILNKYNQNLVIFVNKGSQTTEKTGTQRRRNHSSWYLRCVKMKFSLRLVKIK